MKNEPSQTRSQRARHQFQHEVPTVIHDREQDMMILARWAHRALKHPTQFWGAVVGVALALLAIVLLSTMATSGSSGGDVWAKLEAAKTAADRLQVAEDFPKSPVATWARLQAATDFYNQAFEDLPNNRDVALPTLKKALDNFDVVLKESPIDSPQARSAAFGKARTLEARNELARAIEQYQYVEKTWPGSMEAARAKQLAATLKKPEAEAFYKQLYAHSPTRVTLPPLGSQNLNLPLVPAPGAAPGPAEATLPGLPPTIPLLPPPPPLPVSGATSPDGKEAAAEKTARPAAPAPASAPAMPEKPFEESPAAPKPGSTPATAPASAPAPTTAPGPAPGPASAPAPRTDTRPLEKSKS